MSIYQELIDASKLS